VLFNGNPLLRFDAYYVLSDALDLPNLGPRSNAYLRYLLQRYLFGIRSAVSPAHSAAERAWFVLYAPASFVYRVSLSVLIVLWIAAQSVALGVLAGLWIVLTLLIRPIVSGIRFLLESRSLINRRVRATFASVGLACAFAVFVWQIPFPYASVAQGVVWLPEHARIRAATDGFIERILVSDGERVERDQPLLVLKDPKLVTERERLSAQLASLDVELQAALTTSPVRAQSLNEQIERVKAELGEIERRLASLTVLSPADGLLVMPKQQDTLSGFVGKGAILAHVLTSEDISIRVAVPHQDAVLIRERVNHVEVRLAESALEELQGRIVREVPATTHTLPSSALGDHGGGAFTTDPADSNGLQTLEPVVLFDVNLPDKSIDRIGGRAWVRFDHGFEPLAARGSRALRQLLLKHFEVEQS